LTRGEPTASHEGTFFGVAGGDASKGSGGEPGAPGGSGAAR
jgi:hypothetical protein